MVYAFEKLEIWQRGMDIVEEVYMLTRKFPKEELFGLTSQMRRAATSIPLNIAEGSSRRSKKDFYVFLRRSIGSVIELVTALKIVTKEKYISETHAQKLNEILEKEYFQIIAFEKSVRKSI